MTNDVGVSVAHAAALLGGPETTVRRRFETAKVVTRRRVGTEVQWRDALRRDAESQRRRSRTPAVAVPDPEPSRAGSHADLGLKPKQIPVIPTRTAPHETVPPPVAEFPAPTRREVTDLPVE